jgi:hypothetical protein
LSEAVGEGEAAGLGRVDELEAAGVFFAGAAAVLERFVRFLFDGGQVLWGFLAAAVGAGRAVEEVV